MPCSDVVNDTQVISFLRECRVDVRVDVDVTVVHFLSMHCVFSLERFGTTATRNDVCFLHRSHIPRLQKKADYNCHWAQTGPLQLKQQKYNLTNCFKNDYLGMELRNVLPTGTPHDLNH